MPEQRSLLYRHRQLAPTASVRVSPICLGAMNFGQADKDKMGECTKETAFEILDYFIAQGGNFIDTANAYQSGESETWLGEWMTERQNRDEIVLATKYTISHRMHEKNVIQSNFGGNGSKSMKVSIDASLKRLRTHYIDLFYLHWWDYSTSIPELMHSLNDLIVAGKVLYLGISDTPAWVVSKANQYARDHGLRQFSVYQGMWNAGMRDFEREIIPMCRDEGMGMAPYGVLGQGRFQTEQGYKERERNNEGRNFIPLSDHDKSVSKVLDGIAQAKKTTVVSIAFAYVMHKAPYVFPILGGRKVDHLKGNIEALSISLSKEDMEKIDSAYHFDAGFPHTFLGGSLFAGAEAKPVGGYEAKDVALTQWFGVFDWVENPKPILPGQ